MAFYSKHQKSQAGWFMLAPNAPSIRASSKPHRNSNVSRRQLSAGISAPGSETMHDRLASFAFSLHHLNLNNLNILHHRSSGNLVMEHLPLARIDGSTILVPNSLHPEEPATSHAAQHAERACVTYLPPMLTTETNTRHSEPG